MWLSCGIVCRGGVHEGTVPLALPSAGFQSLPLLSTIKLGPSGAHSQVGEFVYILESCGSLQWTLLWGWEFLPLPPQPAEVFSVRGSEALFPRAGTLGCTVYIIPQLFLPVYAHAKVGLPSPPAATLPCPVLQPLPCQEWSPHSCLSLPLLQVWMNVSSLNPWLSNFHTVWFFVSSGCFLFLNLPLSFFWLCKEAHCVYLHLHRSWHKHLFSTYIVSFIEPSAWYTLNKWYIFNKCFGRKDWLNWSSSYYVLKLHA